MIVHGRGVGNMYKVALDGYYQETKTIKDYDKRMRNIDEFQNYLRTTSYDELKQWYQLYLHKPKQKRSKNVKTS